MRAKLKSLPSFSTGVSPQSDAIKLLKLIRQISYEFESQRYPFLSVHNTVQQSYSMFQKLHQTINEYYENFYIKLDMLDHCGASISGHLTLTNFILKNKNITHPLPTDLSNANSKQKKDITPFFLCGLNRKKYQGLLDEVANSYLNGRNEYPTTLVSAKDLAISWRGFQKDETIPRANDGAAFNTGSEYEACAHTTVNGTKMGKDNTTTVKCFNCNSYHYRNEYPELVNEKEEENAPDITGHKLTTIGTGV